MCVVGGDAVGKKRDYKLPQVLRKAFPVFGSHDAKTEQALAIMAAAGQVVETFGLKAAAGSRHDRA